MVTAAERFVAASPSEDEHAATASTPASASGASDRAYLLLLDLSLEFMIWS